MNKDAVQNYDEEIKLYLSSIKSFIKKGVSYSIMVLLTFITLFYVENYGSAGESVFYLYLILFFLFLRLSYLYLWVNLETKRFLDFLNQAFDLGFEVKMRFSKILILKDSEVVLEVLVFPVYKIMHFRQIEKALKLFQKEYEKKEKNNLPDINL